MLCQGLSIFQNLLSILASSLSIGKDLKSSSDANHPPGPDLQKEIDDYISSARNTLVEVNGLLAANAPVLTSAEFHFHANQSGILEQELHCIQNQRLKGIDAASRSSKAEALHNDAETKKAESEELRVVVSLVSAIAQKRAHTLKTLEELTVVCGRDPTFQRQLDFLSLSEEIINISRNLNNIGRTFEELISPTYPATPNNGESELLPPDEKRPLEENQDGSNNERGFAAIRGGPTEAKVQPNEVGPLMRLRPFNMP